MSLASSAHAEPKVCYESTRYYVEFETKGELEIKDERIKGSGLKSSNTANVQEPAALFPHSF